MGSGVTCWAWIFLHPCAPASILYGYNLGAWCYNFGAWCLCSKGYFHTSRQNIYLQYMHRCLQTLTLNNLNKSTESKLTLWLLMVTKYHLLYYLIADLYSLFILCYMQVWSKSIHCMVQKIMHRTPILDISKCRCDLANNVKVTKI